MEIFFFQLPQRVENGQIFREFWGKIGILDSFRRDWCESKCRAAAHQCVNCETFPSLVNWNTNQFCLEPTQFSWGITTEIVLRYLCRLFSEASGATKPLISPTIHRQWGSFWKYANTGFGTSCKFNLFSEMNAKILYDFSKKDSTYASHISNVWHRSQLVLVDLRRRRVSQRPTMTPCLNIRHHQTAPENRGTLAQI